MTGNVWRAARAWAKGLTIGIAFVAAGHEASTASDTTNLELSHKGGWAPWSKTPDFHSRREVAFELRDPSSRRPDYKGPFLPRWQVRCFSPGNPFVDVFDEDHAGRYPGGALPAPGERRPFKIVFETKRLKPGGVYAGWPAEPYELPVHCTLKVGLFLRGQHPGSPGKSAEDFSPAPGQPMWQSELIQFTIKNDDSMAKPPDVSIDTLALAGDRSGRDPLEGGRDFWVLVGMTQNSGLPAISYECDLIRDGSRVKGAIGVVSFGLIEKGRKVSGSGAADYGPQPKGDYEVRCQAKGVPSSLDTDPSNSSLSHRRQVTSEIKGPGPDLRIVELEVRDAARFGSITPTAGHPVRSHLVIENRGTADLTRDGKVVCTASKAGRNLGKGDTWVEAPFKKSSRREVAVNLPALDAVTDVSMLCGVDAAGDPDPMNNLKQVAFTIEPERSTDFRIDLTLKGGWSEWSGTPGVSTRRQVSFDVHNPSRRGPATPSYAGQMELRWQAVCHCVNSPFVHLFADDHIGRHPGGALPMPATKRAIAIGFETKRPHPSQPGTYAGFVAEPRTLQVQCTLRTGLFLKGNVPGGGGKSEHDYMIAPGQKAWWTSVVNFNVTNSDGR